MLEPEINKPPQLLSLQIRTPISPGNADTMSSLQTVRAVATGLPVSPYSEYSRSLLELKNQLTSPDPETAAGHMISRYRVKRINSDRIN